MRIFESLCDVDHCLAEQESEGMKAPFRSTVLLSALVIVAVTNVRSQCIGSLPLTLESVPYHVAAKTHFQFGESDQTHGLMLDALKQYRAAASAEPKNKKYAKKAAESVGPAAAEAVKHAESCSQSHNYELQNAWLLLALEIDPKNTQATAEQVALKQSLENTRTELTQVREAIRKHDFSSAEQKLRSISQLPMAGSLKEEILAIHAYAEAAEALDRAESNARAGWFIQAKADLNDAEAYSDPEFQRERATACKRLAIDLFSSQAGGNPERHSLDELNSSMERLDLIERLDPNIPGIAQRRGEVETAISQKVISTAKKWDYPERSRELL